jgi:hypothetical protein
MWPLNGLCFLRHFELLICSWCTEARLGHFGVSPGPCKWLDQGLVAWSATLPKRGFGAVTADQWKSGASLGRASCNFAVSRELLNAYERGLGEHYDVTRERP